MSVSFPSPTIGFVSTYPPTVCGLATFTESLRGAVAASRGSGTGLGVLRMTDATDLEWRRQGSVSSHRRGDRRSLRAGVKFLRTFDAVSVQHEFGIYGGWDGREVLDLVGGLDGPVATTFHTVLSQPTSHQRSIIEQLAAGSSQAIVMSQTASQRLIRHYDVDPDRVQVIPHGADDRFSGPSLATGERPLILTWGLIGPGKGLEIAIEACTRLVGLVPRPRYLIAGATHPNVRRVDGEAYRESLTALVSRLGLDDVVEFDDRYLEADDLARLVRSADLVVLPYSSVEQVTSGVLVEAISASKPVIATAFPHSVEVLSSGAGVLVPHADASALGDALRRTITDTTGMRRMALEAERIAMGWDWPTIGRRFDALLGRLVPDGRMQGAPSGLPEVHHVAG